MHLSRIEERNYPRMTKKPKIKKEKINKKVSIDKFNIYEDKFFIDFHFFSNNHTNTKNKKEREKIVTKQTN